MATTEKKEKKSGGKKGAEKQQTQKAHAGVDLPVPAPRLRGYYTGDGSTCSEGPSSHGEECS